VPHGDLDPQGPFENGDGAFFVDITVNGTPWASISRKEFPWRC
jgi:hypothetical protein